MEPSSNSLRTTTYTGLFWCQVKQFADVTEYVWNSPRHTFEFGQANEIKVRSSWRLNVYPFGVNDEDRGYVSLFLELVDLAVESPKEQDIQLTLSIIDNGNVHRHLQTTRRIFNAERSGRDWGYARFIERDTVLAPESNLLTGPNLRLCCRLKMKAIRMEPGNESERVDPIEAESSYCVKNCDILWRQLTEKKYTDVVFRVAGEDFHLHKVVMARCQVFEAMFNSNMVEADCNQINIENVEPEVFKEIVRYIYIGKVENLEELAMKLIISADMYCLDGLIRKCEETISKKLSAENAAATFQLAKLLRLDRLQKDATGFIIQHSLDVTTHESFKNLDMESVREIAVILAGGLMETQRKKRRTGPSERRLDP